MCCSSLGGLFLELFLQVLGSQVMMLFWLALLTGSRTGLRMVLFHFLLGFCVFGGLLLHFFYFLDRSPYYLFFAPYTRFIWPRGPF